MIQTRIPALALALGALSLPAAAAEVTGAGTVTFVGFHIGDRPVAGNQSLGQDHLRGVILADDPANPLHMAAQDCIGSGIYAPDGAEDSAGYCDMIDPEGNVAFIWYRNDGEDRAWGFLGGTGKFAGVTGGGTTAVIGGTPDGRVVIRWQGSWTMQD